MKPIASLSPQVRARTLRSFSAYYSRVHKTQSQIAHACLPAEDLEGFMPPMSAYLGTSATTLLEGLAQVQTSAQESLLDWLASKGLRIGGNVSALTQKKLYLLHGIYLRKHESLARIERVRAKGVLDAIRLSPMSGYVELVLSQPQLETRDGLYECYVLYGSEAVGISFNSAENLLTLTVPLRGEKRWTLEGVK